MRSILKNVNNSRGCNSSCRSSPTSDHPNFPPSFSNPKERLMDGWDLPMKSFPRVHQSFKKVKVMVSYFKKPQNFNSIAQAKFGCHAEEATLLLVTNGKLLKKGYLAVNNKAR